MPIAESKLSTWAHQGAITAARQTYRAIQTALEAGSSSVAPRGFEVYLQGSYKNDTNVRSDSDVDVVVEFRETFGRDLAALPLEQQRAYALAYQDAAYKLEHFRSGVLSALQNHFGRTAVSRGRKSIKVAPAYRLRADVVPCITFRRYLYFRSLGDQNYVEGIRFDIPSENNRTVINYPKRHYDNGVAKNSPARTNGWYKHTVRMFKNARSKLIDGGAIGQGLAPSYFLECLLFNVPDRCFGGGDEETFYGVLNWLNQANLQNLKCQNGVVNLFGESPEQWSTSQASELIGALVGLWNNS
ncbi:MAG: nucleotidyltransferase [Candidatus Omnitrophica bacterium]|nr:nucleotidyltransferase [Candidatus Omnitrophota bacterium]